MINYLTYNNIAVNSDVHGVLSFDVDRVLAIARKSYNIMSHTIEDKVREILDDKYLRDVETRSDMTKVINTKLVELNNYIVPIARINRIANSECPDWLKLPEFLDMTDIVISAIPSNKNGVLDFNAPVLRFNYLQLINNVLNSNDVFTDIHRDELLKLIEDYIDTDKGFLGVSLHDERQVHETTMRMKKDILKIVNDYIVRLSTPLLLSSMKDTYITNPYFAYDLLGDKGIHYTLDRVLLLLDAMGYAAVSNPDEFEDYINTMCSELEEELSGILNSDKLDTEDEYLESNISLSVNLSLLNRILFVYNNNIDLDSVEGLIYPEPLVSQLELEVVYVDECVEMMNYDYILEDLRSNFEVDDAVVRKDIEDMITELKETFRTLKREDYTLDVIYKGVKHTYDDMFGRIYDKLRKDRRGNNSKNYLINGLSSFTNTITNHMNPPNRGR